MDLKPKHGTIPAATIKDKKYGLFEVIFDEEMPKRFDQMIHFVAQPPAGSAIRQGARITRKEKLFPNYRKIIAPMNTGRDVADWNASRQSDRYQLEINALTGESITSIGDGLWTSRRPIVTEMRSEAKTYHGSVHDEISDTELVTYHGSVDGEPTAKELAAILQSQCLFEFI